MCYEEAVFLGERDLWCGRGLHDVQAWRIDRFHCQTDPQQSGGDAGSRSEGSFLTKRRSESSRWLLGMQHIGLFERLLYLGQIARAAIRRQ